MNTKRTKKMILVLGMHRSGTSALSAGLEFLGASLGKKRDEISSENPKGFFENKDIVDLNEELLFFFKSHWDDPFFDAQQAMVLVSPSKLRQISRRALDVLTDNFANVEVAAIKDPRMFMLIPFWEPVIKKYMKSEEGIYYVHIVRNPLNVAKSQMKRHYAVPDYHYTGHTIEEVLPLWFMTYVRGLGSITMNNNIMVSYEDLLCLPRDVLVRIARFVDIAIVPSSLEEYATSFIDKSLDRAGSLPTDAISLIEQDTPIMRLYDEIIKLSKGVSFTKEQASEISQRYSSVQQSAHFFSPVFQMVIRTRDEIRRVKNQEILLQQALSLKERELQYAKEENVKKEQELELYRVLSPSSDPVLDRALVQLAEKEALLRKIFYSKSWRITAPFRFIADRFLYSPLTVIKEHPRSRKILSAARGSKFGDALFRYLLPSAIRSRVQHYWHDVACVVSDPWIERIPVFSEQIRTMIIPSYENICVSIIVPACNNFQLNLQCLNAVIKNSGKVHYEIILVDDASTDETVHIEKYVKHLRVVRNNKNEGFLLSCNKGAKCAKGTYILFLNNDTQVQPNWLEPLVRLMTADEGIGIVGSKLIFSDGKLQEAGGIVWQDGGAWNYGRLDDPDKPEYNYVRETDYVSGASLMIRSKVWKEIGGFDTRYIPAYAEDTDLAFEARERGYKVIYQPQSVVVHFEGQSNGIDACSGIKKYQKENLDKFFLKWQKRIEQEHFPHGKSVFHARGRTMRTKTVLFIDHYVPNFDKDAGSKCTYQYVDVFLSMGYHVIFLADNFFKVEPYTNDLQQKGVCILYGSWYHNNIQHWLKENLTYIDVAYLNRPHVSIKYIDSIRKFSHVVVLYFGHDLHFLREQRLCELLQNKAQLKDVDHLKRMELKIFESSDLIFAVGSHEQQVIQQLVPHQKVINVPVYVYSSVQKISYCAEERDGILFVGGGNHPPNTDAIIWFLQNIYPIVLQKEPAMRLYIVGGGLSRKVRELKSEHVFFTGYLSEDDLKAQYCGRRLAIVPLRYGAGMKGKVLEALYYQLPLITTSIGAEGIDGIDRISEVEDNPILFAEKLVSLYHNTKELQRRSEESYNFISQFTNKERVIDLLLQEIEPLLQKKVRS
jgi:GT2 family glycosyltransferase